MIGETVIPIPVLSNPNILVSPRLLENMKLICEKDRPDIHIEDGYKSSTGYDYVINEALELFLVQASKNHGFDYVDSSWQIKEEERKIKERMDKSKRDHQELLLREKATENIIQKEMARLRKDEVKNEK